jgi:hypothetical protein
MVCVRHMVDGAVKREVRTFKTTTKDLSVGGGAGSSIFLYSPHGLIMIGCLPDLIKAQTRTA